MKTSTQPKITMKKLTTFLVAFLLTANCLLPTFLSAQSFANLWTQTNNPSASSDLAYAITSDSSGIYVAGAENGNDQWRIEKRNLTTGALIWTQTSNPSTGNDVVWAITSDASGIYVAGTDESMGAGNYQWRIEKRDLSTGSVIWTQTSNPSAGDDRTQAIIADASGIYVAGYDYSMSNYQWRIEKRDLTTGVLIAAFDGDGVVTSNPSASSDYAQAITSDASGIYVAGYDLITGNWQWRIEKRDLTTGALIAAFDGDGVVTSNPSTGNDYVYAITADASGIYVTGRDESMGAGNSQWLIEKRNLTTGALIWTQTSNPSTGNDIARAISAETSGIYIAGTDYSPGNEQWRIEKRDLSTGNLICTQTSNPNIDDQAFAITADASGIYMAGHDDSPLNQQWRMEKYDLCAVGTILDFTATPTNGCKPLSVTFTNTSTNPNAYRFEWNFQDGSPTFVDTMILNETLVHTYTTTGNYNPNVNVYDNTGAFLGSTSGSSGNIQVDGLSSINMPDSVCLGDGVGFCPNGQVNSAFWDFGDGYTSTDECTQHAYSSFGTYTVTLIANTLCGNDTVNRVIQVTPNSFPNSNWWTNGQTSVCPNQQIYFRTDPTATYSWTFGDGNSSTQQDPIYSYTATGTYTVTLSKTNICGKTSVSPGTIVVSNNVTFPNDPWFTLNPNGSPACPNSNIGFNAPNGFSNYEWNYGDGSPPVTTSQDYSDHTYGSAVGTYTVSVKITNACNNDTTLYSTVQISNTAPFPNHTPSSRIIFSVIKSKVDFL